MKVVQILICVLLISFTLAEDKADKSVQSARVPYKCLDGFAWNSQTCVSCKKIDNGYCTCTSYNQCISVVCNTGYQNTGTLDQPKCEKCTGFGCIQCGLNDAKNAQVCFKCDTGYTLLGGVCKLNDNCLTYDAKTSICSACVSGYYFNWQLNYPATSQNTDALNGEYQSFCTKCNILNCKECTATTCLECATNYTWKVETSDNAGSCQQTTCFTNQYKDTNAICQNCVQGCSTCKNGTSCDTCQTGLFYDSTSNKCTCGVTGCAQCDTTTTCKVCNSGLFYDTDSKICKCTVANCQTCVNNFNTCGLCLATFVAFEGLCYPEILGCTSYGEFNTQKLTCNACADTYTRSVDSGTKLGTCLTCQSTDSQNVNSRLRCKSSADDPTASSLPQATQCSDANYLFGTKGCFPVANGCLTWSNVSGNCATCFDGQQLYQTNNTCINCPEHCLSCPVQTSISTGECNQCSDGYYNGANGSCVQCTDKCATCKSSNNCQTCLPGNYLNNQTCAGCAVVNCSVCTNGQNLCKTCSEGFFKSNLNGDDLCTGCKAKFYEKTINNVKTCANCPANCEFCDNSVKCTICSPGYIKQNDGCVLNAQANCYRMGTNKCLVCQYGYFMNSLGMCTRCMDLLTLGVCSQSFVNQYPYDVQITDTQSKQVKSVNRSIVNRTFQYSCNPGYYWNSQLCLPCMQINNGYCQCDKQGYGKCDVAVCNTGYINISVNAPNCQNCFNGCKTCGINSLSNAAICFTCNDGYTLIGGICISSKSCVEFDKSGLCKTCADGFYFNFQPNKAITYSDDDYWQHYPEQCSKCPIQNCKTCQSSDICSLCLTNYQWNPQTKACQFACPIDKCQTCSNSTTCSNCLPTYYLSSNSCQLCSQNCLQCSSGTKCSACSPQWYLKPDSTCGQCNSLCSTCLDASTCLTCSNPLYVVIKNSSDNTSLCYQPIEGCATHEAKTSQGSTIITCQSCQDTYTRKVDGSSITCQPCKAINSSWFRCLGPNDNPASSQNPSQCDEGFYLVNRQSCIPIDNYSNCLTLDKSSSIYDNVCATCADGFILTKDNKCIQCYTGCQTCVYDSNTTPNLKCTACSTGYVLNATSTGCDICNSILNCLACKLDSTAKQTCLSCQSGYFQASGDVGCQQCLAKCNSCTKSTDCSSCVDGYFLSTQNTTVQCLKCPANCKSCKSPGQQCDQCIDNYLFQGSGGCVSAQNANCLLIKDQTCSVCKYGFQLVGGLCLTCYDPLSGYICRGNEIPSS